MNIFIAGLSYQINDADLKQLFEEYGTISSAKVITDRDTGRSKGYGFVEMDDESGQKAVDALDGFELLDRNLRVSVANSEQDDDK